MVLTIQHGAVAPQGMLAAALKIDACVGRVVTRPASLTAALSVFKEQIGVPGIDRTPKSLHKLVFAEPLPLVVERARDSVALSGVALHPMLPTERCHPQSRDKNDG